MPEVARRRTGNRWARAGALALAALLIAAQPPNQFIEPDARLELGTALALPRTLDYDIAPDGRRVVLSVAMRNRAVLFLTAPGATPGILTGGRRWDTSPRFLPDGTTVVFVAGRRPRGDDPAVGALHRMPLGGTPERLTPEGLEAREPAVAPDGERVAFLGRDRETRPEAGFDVWITGGGETRRLTGAPGDEGAPVWSPDGSRIATAMETDEHRMLAVVPAAGGDPVFLAEDPSGPAAWTPDGNSLVWAGPWDGFDALLQRDAQAVGPIRPLVTEDRDLGQPAFRPTGAEPELAWIEADRGDYRIHRSPVEPHPDGGWRITGRARPLHRGGGVHDRLRWTNDGEALAALFESSAFPRDVWVFPRAGGRERMSDTIFPDLDVRAFARPERIEGAEADGFLHRPVGMDAEAPLVVYLTGTDGVASRNGFSPLIQLLAVEGYAVLAPTLPGGDGRGQRFRDRNDRDWGGADRDALAAMTRLVLEQPGIADRACVFGVHYGGFLALAALSRHPDLFACGIEAMGFADLPELYRNLDPGRRQLLERELGPLRGNLELYRRLSLRGGGETVTAPLLSFHGEEVPEAPLEAKRGFLEELRRRPQYPLLDMFFRHDRGRALFRFETDRIAYHAFLDRVLEFLSLHLPKSPGAQNPADAVR